jgi:hypothetical protein
VIAVNPCCVFHPVSSLGALFDRSGNAHRLMAPIGLKFKNYLRSSNGSSIFFQIQVGHGIPLALQ